MESMEVSELMHVCDRALCVQSALTRPCTHVLLDGLPSLLLDSPCTVRDLQVLAETAKTLPVGTSASTTIPLLSSLGPEGARVAAQQHSHEPHHDTAAQSSSSQQSSSAPASTSQPAKQEESPEAKKDQLFIARYEASRHSQF